MTLASGEGASPGVGIGVVVRDSDEAERRAHAGEAVVLARPTTSPEDLHGMIASRAVVTEQGGGASHAAVVGRALGLPCVVGCGKGSLEAFAERIVTVDGKAGRVYEGALSIEAPDASDHEALMTLGEWAAARSPLRVVRPSSPEAPEAVDLSGEHRRRRPGDDWRGPAAPERRARGERRRDRLGRGRARRAFGRARVHRRRSRPAASARRLALEVRNRGVILRLERAAMTDIKPQDIEALLETFDGSTWQEMHLKIEGLELFPFKDAGRPRTGSLRIIPPIRRPLRRCARPPQSRRRARSRQAKPARGPSPWTRTSIIGSRCARPISALSIVRRSPARRPMSRSGRGSEADTEVCLIEVMKLFTSVLAGVAGVVRKVLVEDAELVEYDQPLFLIEPA